MIDDGENGHKRKAIGEPDDEACDTDNAAPQKRQTRNVVNHASPVLSASILGSRATSASSDIAVIAVNKGVLVWCRFLSFDHSIR